MNDADWCIEVELPETMDGLQVRKRFMFVEKGAVLSDRG